VFDGVRLKLERSDELRAEISAAIESFQRSNPVRLEREIRDGGRRHIYSAREVAQPPGRLGVVVGDCVHNLRSALDHMIYEAANGESLPEGTARRLCFPIALDAPAFAAIRAGALYGVPRPVQDVVEAHQPYNQYTTPDVSPLWSLNRLWNVDKHRLVRLPWHAPEYGSYALPPGVALVGAPWRIPPLGVISEGQVVAEFEFVEPQPSLDVEAALNMEIVLTDLAQRMLPVNSLLASLGGATQQIVSRVQDAI
jgi:hypothetical protein